MTATSEWLDGYLTAWRTKDADDIRAIFTDDAEYLFHPYDAEPLRGMSGSALLAAFTGPVDRSGAGDRLGRRSICGAGGCVGGRPHRDCPPSRCTLTRCQA